MKKVLSAKDLLDFLKLQHGDLLYCYGPAALEVAREQCDDLEIVGDIDQAWCLYYIFRSIH